MSGLTEEAHPTRVRVPWVACSAALEIEGAMLRRIAEVLAALWAGLSASTDHGYIANDGADRRDTSEGSR
jgi:hypothetical protein